MDYTPIQSKFWSDGWVRQLNALDRYLFLYLLTNQHNDLSGVYELPIDLMAHESGIDQKDLQMSMLRRLEPKVYYREGWVIVVNQPKHQRSGSPTLDKGIANSFAKVPPKIRELAISYGYPIHTLPKPSPTTKLNETKLNISEVGTSRVDKKKV